MNLLQSLAGGAMERLSATLAPKARPTDETGSGGKDFAAALALAMDAEPVDGAGEVEEGSELEAALEAALAGAPDPTAMQNSLAMLDPEFKAKLLRVIERMEAEFGHEVKVLETFRTQDRQNHLYEQGRSRPGQVVTWTRASNHTLGRAADLLIDGKWDNPAGFARLAEIAAEEGLRTLGARDPGHVELPGGGRKSSVPQFAQAEVGAAAKLVEGAAQQKWEPALEVAPQPNRQLGLARVAEVARVADVAQVAQVARIAAVADPAFQGVTVLAAQGARPAVEPSSVRTADAVQALHQAMGNHQGIASLRSEMSRSFGGEGGNGYSESESSSHDSSLFRADAPLLAGGSFRNAVNELLATTGATGAERAARILEMQDGAAAGPMSHVMLRVDNPSGGEDRIRVDLRGSSVDAQISMANAGEAERVNARLGELRTTLERHGLEAQSLDVRSSTASKTEAVELPRLGIALTESDSSRGAGSRSGSNSSDSFREAWKESNQGQRRDPSDPRQQQRARRATPEKENA